MIKKKPKKKNALQKANSALKKAQGAHTIKSAKQKLKIKENS